MGAGHEGMRAAGGPAPRTRPRWTAPCVVVAVVATLVLTDPADATRADAQRRAGRAAATRVALDPTVNQATPGLAEFARALAAGRMADASRIADRLAANPPSAAAAAAEVGAAQLPAPARDLVCQRIRALQTVFPAFGSVFARLLAAFGCPAGPATTTTVAATTTTGFSATSTVAPPTTSMPGSSTIAPGPTTTLPVCGPISSTTTFPSTTVPCIPGTTTSTSTTLAPGVTTSAPTSTSIASPTSVVPPGATTTTTPPGGTTTTTEHMHP